MTTVSDVIAEIHAAIEKEERRPGEITIADYAQRYGMTRDKARGVLNRAVGQGLLTSRQARDRETGRMTIVYKLTREATE